MEFQKPRGTRDMYDQDITIYNNIINILQTVVSKYNYQEFTTPFFESANLFLRAVGATSDIMQKEIYQFNDKKGRVLALRPEGTAGIVRAIIENKLYQPKRTLKYFYYGAMFRYERPQKGRQRQFNQFGIEAIGMKSPFLDVEIMLMALEMMKELAIPNLTLNINYFGSETTKNKYQSAFKAELLKNKNKLCQLCQERSAVAPLRVLDCKVCGKLKLIIPQLHTFLTSEEKTYFADIINILTNSNVKFIVDDNLVRGLDYYNGIIFEITTSDERIGQSQNTLVGGGRYDNLFTELGYASNVPAIGFAIGMERLMLLLSENELVTKKAPLQLQIIALQESALSLSFKLLTQLRQQNYRVDGEYNLYQDKNKTQLIDRYQTAYILFLKEIPQAQLYVFKEKKIVSLTFNDEEQLLTQVKNYLLKEQ